MARARKDHAALEARGMITETAAAEILKITRTTLARWRRDGKAPASERVHARLIGYSRAAVEKLAKSLAAPVAAAA